MNVFLVLSCFASSVALLPGQNGQGKSMAVYEDSSLTGRLKARFVRRTDEGYCGFFYLPEKDLFEVTTAEQGKLFRKYVEVEYYNRCKPMDFVVGKEYTIPVKKMPEAKIADSLKIYPLTGSHQ